MPKLVTLMLTLTGALNLTASGIITNCAQLAQHVIGGTGQNRLFHFEDVTIISTNDASLIVLDNDIASPHLFNQRMSKWAVHPGDRVDISGFIAAHPDGECIAHFNRLKILKHDIPIPPRRVSGKDFQNKTNDFHFVEIQGTVKDVFHDDIDPAYIYLTVLCQGEIICMPLGFHTANELYADAESNGASEDYIKLIGATIRATGNCLPRLFGNRRFLGRTLQNPTLFILSPASADPYDVPDLAQLYFSTPSEIVSAGRHGTIGTVLCSWDRGTSLLLRTKKEVVRVNLLQGNVPHVGACIKAVGTPISNGYHIDLSRAVWSEAKSATPFANEPTTRTSAREILSGKDGKGKINPHYHGRVIQLKGTIKSISDDSTGKKLFVEDGSYLIPVDFSSCPNAFNGMTKDYVVAISGICVLDFENWNPGTAFPLIKGFTLVPRTDTDVVILSRPPWLTRERLMAVIGGLALLLIGVLAWNASLRILANRRGRELFRSQVGKIASELRVKERTRLAVELHDSLAQNLTGVSMEIEAAERSRKDGLEAVSQHLVIADKALKSCRAELRNSLWDLRSQALEEPDLDKAIRQTLLPHVKGISLFVRFNVPRSRFSDNTLHEILRIIRELSLNGIRHGGATEIRIAGAIDGDLLRFSVSDNGCGFDPDDHPGVTDGHFGLQGISERLDTYSGELSFSSAPGKGMRAVVTIPLPGQKDPEK